MSGCVSVRDIGCGFVCVRRESKCVRVRERDTLGGDLCVCVCVCL